ncbi:hypothetical protein DY000_02059482 [Brassica cretica]|uniref:Kinesin motor domain-containing protein n=1 Tax=Brassica cretica TaxID=69181 RepID=A0ABQ7AXP7_BRACR|nr:hypothetical protein DY000_02059482 [Brassica cretica]
MPLESYNEAKPNVRELEPDFKVVKPIQNEKDHVILARVRPSTVQHEVAQA